MAMSSFSFFGAEDWPKPPWPRERIIAANAKRKTIAFENCKVCRMLPYPLLDFVGSFVRFTEPFLQPIGFPQGLGPQSIGLVVADKFVLDDVVFHFPIQIDGSVRGVADEV